MDGPFTHLPDIGDFKSWFWLFTDGSSVQNYVDFFVVWNTSNLIPDSVLNPIIERYNLTNSHDLFWNYLGAKYNDYILLPTVNLSFFFAEGLCGIRLYLHKWFLSYLQYWWSFQSMTLFWPCLFSTLMYRYKQNICC